MEGGAIKGWKDLAECLSAVCFRMVHTYLIFLEWKPKESECYMLILEAAYSLAPGKIHWKSADSCKIMMFMNNDRGGLGGFTHILVPGSKKLAGWSLSGECHKIHGGKYYKSCLAGKQWHVRVSVCSRGWVWTQASPTARPEGLWIRRLCASFGTSTIYSHVWMNGRERGRWRWRKRKIQTNPRDAVA